MALLDTLVCSPSTDIVVKHAVGGGSKNPRRLRMKILPKTCGEGWPVGKLDTCHEGGFPLQIVGFASFFYRRRAEKLQQFCFCQDGPELQGCENQRSNLLEFQKRLKKIYVL